MLHQNRALDAFLNLFGLVTLGWFSLALGRLLFVAIDKVWGDPIFRDGYYWGYDNPFSWPIASLVVITPLFLVISGRLHRFYKQETLSPHSAIYRWLTYFMLLAASLTIAGGLIVLLTKLLDGAYTLATLLKIAVVLVISGGIFSYYLYDMRRASYTRRSSAAQVALYAVIMAAIASIVVGLLLSDTPQTARMKKSDNQRVDNLSSLDYAIADYFQNHEKLPETLESDTFTPYKDPHTAQPYEYRVIDERSYELCADFNLDSNQNLKDTRYPRAVGMHGAANDWFYHRAGRQCFERTLTNESDAIYYRSGPAKVPVPQTK